MKDCRRRFSIGQGQHPAAGLVVFAATCVAATAIAVEGGNDAELLQEARRHFPPLPKDATTAEFPTTPERIRLGRMLFFDPRISADGTASCVRCHLPGLYATDGLPRSVGALGRVLPRNAPTVFYSALHATQHWDGEFATVEDQAKHGLVGMGLANRDYASAMARLKAIPGYRAVFRQAFPGEADPINEVNWSKAIGAFERTLVTPSRFDDYLAGKPDALSEAEREGLRTFVETGCVECHNGRGVGGGGFRKFGVFSDYREATGSRNSDKGRFALTKNPDDVDSFKVPGLRDVAMTPPYFHDGSVADLPKAVAIMAKIQLDADLSEAQVASIVVFLKSLTGPLPEGFERAPILPVGGFATTPPDPRR
jgi:cytochrome c peroxidase